nr:UPF0568 protein C14orf166 homolog [Onthophagus taurus]
MVLLRKLTALQYPNLENINIQDEGVYRNIVVWLEGNRVKKCDQSLSDQLGDTTSSNWNDFYLTYLKSLNCPENINKEAQIDWLAGYTIKSSYQKEKNKFNSIESTKKSTTPNVVTDNPLDKLDFSCQEFYDGVTNLAKVLKVTPHPDHYVTLEACRKVVESHFINEKNPGKDCGNKGTPFPYHNTDLGFDLGDVGLNQAAKVLRLIYIQDLRNLQTKGNEVIVSVQNITANPKTDTKLGKVGK